MKMKMIRTQDAVGHVLTHDLTRIVRGEFKGPQFRKGHIVTKEDIPMLLSMGKEHLYIFELEPGILHENDAAMRLCSICKNDHMSAGDVKEGKIEISAMCDGLFLVDTEKLYKINSIEDIMIATRHSGTAVKSGDKLCGTRIIPLVIDEEKILKAEEIRGVSPILQVVPYTVRSAGLVVTGSEVAAGRIQDTFSPVVEEKLKSYGITVEKRIVSGDGAENICSAITKLRGCGVEMIVCTGGMSVDPDDNTPAAIKQSGADIITYGAPVLPGAMFMLGYFDDGTTIMGLPGCVMYAGATIFDLVLPYAASKTKLNKEFFISKGNGGLCLNCSECHYPACPFGK